MKHPDWDDLRLLLAVKKAGTIRGAAELCRLSAPTLSRRIDGLEAVLGEKLVERMTSGCSMTPAGERVAAWADQMSEVAAQIERSRDLRMPEGVVRINTDEWLSFFLMARSGEFKELYPNIDLEILTSHAPFSLTRREADISLRPARPETGDLVTRRIGSFGFGLYASIGYAKDNHTAWSSESWGALAFVGFDESRAHFPAEAFIKNLPGAPSPWLRCSYALGIYDGVLAGAGIGILADFAAQNERRLVAIKTGIPELQQEIWMTFHQALRGSPRISAVAGWLSEQFRDNSHASQSSKNGSFT
jgi:DNA-binding transcriptional LysR family regulator